MNTSNEISLKWPTRETKNTNIMKRKGRYMKANVKVKGVNLGNWLVLEKWMDTSMFEGTTAVAFSEDEVAPAKVFCKHSKDLNKMAVKFGIVNGQIFTKEQVEELSKIPSKDVLIAMLLGTLNAPVSALARALNAIAEKQN